MLTRFAPASSREAFSRPFGVSGDVRFSDAPPSTSGARHSVARAAAIMGAPDHAEHDIAVIDLVVHLYGTSTASRRQLANLWCVRFNVPPPRQHRSRCRLNRRRTSHDPPSFRFPRAKYTLDSAEERTSAGFEIVRMHHATLTRTFCDDPDGECLDLDDIRSVWEEFVDALRLATAAAEDTPPSPTSRDYRDVERPAMARSPSFAKLVDDLHSHSDAEKPLFRQVSQRGMILGVGCSSREGSARGGGEFFKKGETDTDQIVERLRDRGLAGTVDAHE